MAGHVQKAKSPWAPEKSKREQGTLERVEKKKEKPKTAAAGGGMKPPAKPPKGPTGGDNKGPKNNKDYKMNKDNDKSLGGLTKGSRKEQTQNPFKKGK
jgi:hypothetical protein